MPTFLLYGDTLRHPAIRHEVPLEIMDPLLVVVRDGGPLVLTSSLEAARVREAVPGAELLLIDELGYHELVEGDPFVRNGVVRRSEIRGWDDVLDKR